MAPSPFAQIDPLEPPPVARTLAVPLGSVTLSSRKRIRRLCRAASPGTSTSTRTRTPSSRPAIVFTPQDSIPRLTEHRAAPHIVDAEGAGGPGTLGALVDRGGDQRRQ